MKMPLPASVLTALALSLCGCGSSAPPPVEPAAASFASPGVPSAPRYNTLVAGSTPTVTGAFTEPFCEEKFLSDYRDEDIPDRGDASNGMTNPAPLPYAALEHCARRSENKFYECKPSAGSLALLPDDRLLYFNALESVENSEFSFAAEIGGVTVNDQTRVLALGRDGRARWSRPSPVDGGARNPTNDTDGGDGDPFGDVSPDDPANNDGSLFCAHLLNLHDGRVMVAGGTDYYQRNGYFGEVEGLRNVRIFDPASSRWTQADPMSWARWYPAMTTLANGHVFIASGVRRLIAPMYADRPPEESLRNETHTEVFQPGCNGGRGKWTDNREPGQRSLPLYPKLRVLPNGHVLYAAGGINWSPFGQAWDEPLWNLMATWDPGANAWAELGIPGIGTPFPGFRGSTTQVMLPLQPDAAGQYPRAEFLTMGGTIATSPGSYLPVTDSRIDAVDVAPVTGAMTLTSRSTGALGVPRWFGQAILLPSGEIMLFSGGTADEVVAPGSEAAIVETEMWDPATGEWTVMATQGRPRTYHNTAALLPDGRVLVGGHATHAFAYMVYFDPPTRGPEGHDPTFEIYSPPYMFRPRPQIRGVSAATAAPGSTLTIQTPDAARIAAEGFVVLVRRGAVTHLTDGDQRSVVLRITAHTASSLTVRIPSNNPLTREAVVPPGHYMLFIAKREDGKAIPSVSAPLRVTGADLSCR
jgi:hypothetical protein